MHDHRRTSGFAGRAVHVFFVVLALSLTAGLLAQGPIARADDGCAGSPGANAIVCENQLPGTPADQWDIQGAGDATIQGFATQMSVNVGERVDFKIDTDATDYGIQIFRLGWYQGLGARKITDVTPSASLPQKQPACATDATTEIYDCGTWAVSAGWDVPSTAVSGVYLALLTRADTGGRSQIPFVVRDDASTSAAVFQTSDATWQAYNLYGGSDFYAGKANGRAYKVSYNRPIITRGSTDGRDYLFANEYPMLRFLERNGYDLSYISSLDTDIRGANLTKHKIFISTGHDEYWSQGQRDSVTAARDAGVNLAFFSGNEVYWRTRWEPSEDGASTPNRTLVCYKDTWSDTPLDPKGPTSTWRDARGAANPENSLTGTIYKANDTDLAITVSGTEGRMRLWRNTSLATQALGTSTLLAPHTVGYESDEDLDNGYRPAGLINLSTTTGATPQYLTDFGKTVTPGTTVHHLTMYRAASGALVFGAGTVQWAWGLDTYHDQAGTPAPVDIRMQQAMINLFADMSVQPGSLSSPDLVAATGSTDTQAPSVTISSPGSSTVLQNGQSVTVSGSASDAAGQVAGVEVSLDGGRTWHSATGRTSWSYTGVITGNGANTVRARAADDSANLSAPTSLATSAGCPCSLFGATVPTTPAVGDASPVTLGVRFTPATTGYITGIRFYKGSTNTGTHTGTLYAADGTVLATVIFTDETASGWQTATFTSAVPVTAGTGYVAAYTAPNGHYAGDSWFFGYADYGTGLLTADGGSKPNGVYASGLTGFPKTSFQHTNYYVDVVWQATDPTPLTVTAPSPLPASASVGVQSAITAKLSRDPAAGSVAVTVKSAAGASVAGSTSYDAASRTVTFTPSAALANATVYTVTVTAAPAATGVISKPGSWTFVTVKAPQTAGSCPCSLYDDSDLPDVLASADTGSVELGTAFSSDSAGLITGVEFYRGATNVGSHPVSLWSVSGDLLATATATVEISQGWQQVSFDKPVAITAGTTYVVSYRAPQGRYSYTAGALSKPVDRSPLHTAANAGRYTYATGFPSGTSGASYLVDPVFTASATPPSVVSVTPADKTTSTPVSTTITVGFDASIQAGSAAITVRDSTGASVAGTMVNQSVGTSAGFTPSAPLSAGQTYTVTVSGARGLSGVAMSTPSSTTFTTSSVTACPCTLLSSSARPAISDAGDSGAITVGTRFSSSSAGFVVGLRYWRDAANTGTHTGSLYTADGQKLTGVTFSDSGTGWQIAKLDAPVAITAGTSYVVAVYMPNGHYAATADFFSSPYVNMPLTGTQGLFAAGSDRFPTDSYRNTFYGVDPVFSLSNDITAPTISAVKAVAADGKATITWTTDEASSSVVNYGTSAGALTSTASGSSGVTSHSVVITGLTNGKTYNFTVTSADAAQNSATSTSGTFSPADTVAPVISAVTATSVGTTATVAWTTDEAASGSVSFGTAADKLSAGVSESGSGTSHSIKISGLTPQTTYYFQITSADAAGNKATKTGKFLIPGGTSVPLAVGSVVSLQAVDSVDQRMRITGTSAVMSPLAATTAVDARMAMGFVVRAGLAQGTSVSFESAAKPGWFLTVSGSTVGLKANDNTSAFASSATFAPKAGLQGSSVSFASYASPSLYLRRQAGNVVAQANDGTDQFASDATFGVRAPVGVAAGYYKIGNTLSGLPLSTRNNAVTSGTTVVQDTASARITQEWEIRPTADGHYTIINSAGGLLLGIDSGSRSDGAAAVIGTPTSADQIWDIFPRDGHWLLRNVNSGRVLGITNQDRAAGAVALQWSDNGTVDHQWDLGLAGTVYKPGPGTTITNANSGLQLGTVDGSTTQGANVVQLNPGPANTQKWQLVDAGNSTFKIRNVGANQVLGIRDASASDGATALIWADNGTTDHLWRLVPQNGRWLLVNVNSNKVLGINGMDRAAGAQALQWNDNQTADHLWTLAPEPVEGP